MSSTPSIHRISAVVGGVLLLAGIVVVVQPSLASIIPITEVFLPLIAFFGLLLALWRVRVRYNRQLDHIQLPSPELPFSLPTPGDEIDDMLFGYINRGESTLEYPERIGNRLREVAIAVITHRQNCSRDAALTQLEDGSWTDNQYAQAFFSDEIGIPEPPLSERVQRKLGRGQTPYEKQVGETVNAISEVAEIIDRKPSDQGIRENGDRGILDRFRHRENAEQDEEPSETIDPELLQKYIDGDGDPVADGVQYFSTTWTNRWTGIESFALAAAAIGVVLLEPGLVLAGSIAVAYAAYARTGGDPPLTNVAVERHVSDQTPVPGDEIDVTVTVENQGDAFLPDLRLLDLVPANMRVVEGSPRLYTALRPGASATFTYTTVAERGQYEWPLLVVGSGFSGSVERDARVEVAGGISCVPRLQTITQIPVRSQTTAYSGQVETKTGGPGLEFFSVREYRRGDPMRRVDWKRHARTGELATVDFRKEQAARVTLLFDAREGAYVAPGPERRHALDRAVDAATDMYTALANEGNLVGISAFDTVSCWLAPNAGDEHDERASQLLAYHPAISSLPPDMLDKEGGYVDPMTHVRRQLSLGTQIMFFSPLNGEYPAEVARRLDSAGHAVTVISPDPTSDGTTGQRLARVERATRVNRLREWGIPVLDWQFEEPIGLAFQRANQRWRS